MVRIAINGLGRIGRAVLKIAAEHPEIQVVAVNDLLDSENMVYLLRFDSVYGRFHKPVRFENDHLFVDDEKIAFFSEKDPEQLPWKDLDIDVAIESTGMFTNAEGLQKHLNAGAKRAMLSARAKGGGVKTVVPGVNHWEPEDQMISTASCTTNCIAPVVEIMGRRIGVEEAIMTTVHAADRRQRQQKAPPWSSGGD